MKFNSGIFNDDLLRTDLSMDQMFYAQLFAIRRFEETLLKLFSENQLFGTTHTCIGQEANAVAIMNAIDRDIDTVWSNHRCHGHFLAYCGQAEKLFAEIMGKTTGVCAGRGGSQHVCWHKFHTNGIQGGIVPLALGSAMAGKSINALSVVFIGDGTLGEGVLYECLNLASLWQLPVLFVVEDNGIAQTTDKNLAVSGDIIARAEAFGIESYFSESTDVMELYDQASNLVSFVRTRCRPLFWHIKTVRLGPHSKGDETREQQRMDNYRKKDPVVNHKNKIENYLDIESSCNQVIKQALQAAQSAPINDGLLTV
ncbi:MAG: thiamine pyrophosphate-dependent dehydrogenase E1 component subunit alpha [Pseudomonadales bacterium]|nr:thiamine pyrophosphate-dependent dehydrogenase E1 component subunit alpha [Pseudomonadales bacterium]